MPTITHPRFSFIRFGSDDYILPAYANFDVAFQFVVSGDYPAQAPLLLGVCKLDGTIIPNAFPAIAPALQLRTKLSIPAIYYPNFDGYQVLAITVGTVTKNYSNINTYADFQAVMYDDFGYRPLSNLEFLSNRNNDDVLLTLFSDAVGGGSGQVGGDTRQIALSPSWGQGFVAAPGSAIPITMKPGSCFRYCIIDNTGNIIGTSNPFRILDSDNYTTQLTYWNENDFADFVYNYAGEPKANVVRLPVYFNKPTFPESIATSTLSNGEHRLESAFIEEQWEIVTEKMPASFHRAIKMAMRHRNIIADCPQVDEGVIRLVGNDSYTPQWNGSPNATGKGTFLSADFGYTNTNYK